MKNVLSVLKRDLLRLLKTPAALVVVVALLILPSVYTWYNVLAFWNPYDNTGNLRVCVVNEDEGAASSLTSELHIGDMIVEELQKNDQLDWSFTSRDEAMSDLAAGRCYAAFVIPSDFTEKLLTLTTGHFEQPSIQYYVNEKLGPVSPKITDTGATTLDETINSTFVATVSDVAVKAFDEAARDAGQAAEESRSQASAKAGEMLGALADARSNVQAAEAAALQARDKVSDAKAFVAKSGEALSLAGETLGTVSNLAAHTQQLLLTFSSTSLPLANASLGGVADISAKAHAAAGSALSSLAQAQAGIDASLAQGQAVVDQSAALAASLRAASEALPDGDAAKASLAALASELEAANESAQQNLAAMQALSADMAQATSSAQAASDSLDDALQQASENAQSYADELFATTLPAIVENLGQLSAATSSLEASLQSQNVVLLQASSALDQLDALCGTASQAFSQTDALLADAEGQLGSIQADILALGESGALASLLDEGALNADAVAEFIGSPTELKTEQLYELNAYGSAMAPLFMNLTFWIGAFMLLVIMKQEVDAAGIAGLTLTQRYLGRFLLFALLAVVQALVCCAGVLALGVQAENAPALFFAAAVASLAYLSIIYALSVTLQHIGKGICIVLVFAQIPGATGLYPIEMTDSFFQAVYPFFPFTYGIGAMREAICGFYGMQYAADLGMLALFFVLFMAFGILVRPVMANVNCMVARQIRESGLYNGEHVEVPVRPMRLSQLARILANRDEYREQLQARYDRFMRWYPRFIRGAVVVGIVVPVVFVTVLALTPAEKVTMLTLILGFLVALFVFLVVVETLRYNFKRQLDMGEVSNDQLLELYSSRNAMTRADDASAVASGNASGQAPKQGQPCSREGGSTHA